MRLRWDEIEIVREGEISIAFQDTVQRNVVKCSAVQSRAVHCSIVSHGAVIGQVYGETRYTVLL